MNKNFITESRLCRHFSAYTTMHDYYLEGYLMSHKYISQRPLLIIVPK